MKKAMLITIFVLSILIGTLHQGNQWRRIRNNDHFDASNTLSSVRISFIRSCLLWFRYGIPMES